jgi:hypothetical protein
MGGNLTVIPNGTVTGRTYGWTGVGGTLITAVNDANDATYINDGTPVSQATRITWTMTSSTLPAGTAIKYVYPIIRNSQAAGNMKLSTSVWCLNPPANYSYTSPAGQWSPTSTIKDTQSLPAGAIPQSLSQAVLDELVVQLQQYPSNNAAEDHRIYKVSALVQYVDSPTVSDLALNPTSGNTLTTKPGITWGYNSADALAQYEYRVALWKQTDVALFTGGRAAFDADIDNAFLTSFVGTDALVHTPIWVSKDANGVAGWKVSSDTSAVTDVELDGSTAYTYYVQVSSLHAGARLAHPTVGGFLDFTMAITLPTQPSAITPTWQRDFQFQTQVQVTVGSATLGSWTGRRVQVERRPVGGAATDWRLIPLGTQEAGAGAGTLTFYDTLAAVGRTLEYRTRAIYWSSLGYTSASTYRTSTSVVCDYNAFVLRDPLTLSSAVVVKLMGDLDASEEEIQGKFRPLASDRPVIVSDAVLGKEWQVEVLVKDTTVEAALNVLRRLQTPLIFQTDMTDRWYWVRIGPSVSEKTYRQIDRVTASKRTQSWSFSLIEVQPVPGQPQVYI